MTFAHCRFCERLADPDTRMCRGCYSAFDAGRHRPLKAMAKDMIWRIKQGEDLWNPETSDLIAVLTHPDHYRAKRQPQGDGPP